MARLPRVFVRVALVSIVCAPFVAWADALPGDPDDVYFHCTAAEQCPTGSEMCPAIIGPAGQRPVEPKCEQATTAKGLQHRCWGKSGHLFCPPGATGSWKGKDTRATPPAPEGSGPAQPQPVPATAKQKRGC